MIHNIHILINPEPNREAQVLAAHQQLLIEAHRRGEHPWGSMRQDCPLCQVS
jgi:hypothetical protein